MFCPFSILEDREFPKSLLTTKSAIPIVRLFSWDCGSVHTKRVDSDNSIVAIDANFEVIGFK